MDSLEKRNLLLEADRQKKANKFDEEVRKLDTQIAEVKTKKQDYGEKLNENADKMIEQFNRGLF